MAIPYLAKILNSSIAYFFFFFFAVQHVRPSLVAQLVKNLSAMQETWVQSLGWEDPLEKGMMTHYSILTWRIPWIEKPGRYSSWDGKSQTLLSD